MGDQYSAYSGVINVIMLWVDIHQVVQPCKFLI